MTNKVVWIGIKNQSIYLLHLCLLYESVSALMTVIMMMEMEMVTSTPDLTMFPSSLIAGTHGPVRGIDRVAGNGAGQPSDAAAAITVLTPDTGYKHTRSTQTFLLYLSLNKDTSKDRQR